MADHSHRSRVPGCHRCEVGRDEAEAAMRDEISDLDAEVERLRDDLATARRWLSTLVDDLRETRGDRDRLRDGIRPIVRFNAGHAGRTPVLTKQQLDRLRALLDEGNQGV